jgi:hypothetical protein
MTAQFLTVEVVAREADLHPDFVERLVRLGFVEPAAGSARAPLFAVDAPGRLARATRLRHDLGLGWSGALLACDLLDRIDELEARLHRP